MESLWMAIVPNEQTTRLLLTDRLRTTLLKARLHHPPLHHRALPTLLEALAQWHARPIRAVLAVDDPALSSARTSWLDDLDSWRQTPLYDLRIVSRHGRGLGEFGELRELLIEEVAL